MSMTDTLRDRLAKAPNVRALAPLAQISERQLYRIVHGKSSPTLKTAEKIVRALDKLYPEAA